MAFLGTLVALLAVIGGASASTYTVGDQLGWTIPPAGNVAYRVWAAEKSFDFGDTVGTLICRIPLLFPFLPRITQKGRLNEVYWEILCSVQLERNTRRG